MSAVARLAQWRQRDDVLAREVTEGVVLLGVTAEPVVLAGTALLVWRALAEPVTLDELVHSLETQFPGAPGLRTDVVALLDQLEADDLISVVGHRAP